MVFPCLGILGSKTTKKKGLKLGVRIGVFWVYIFLIPPYHIYRRQVQNKLGQKSLEGMEMLCLKKT